MGLGDGGRVCQLKLQRHIQIINLKTCLPAGRLTINNLTINSSAKSIKLLLIDNC